MQGVVLGGRSLIGLSLGEQVKVVAGIQKALQHWLVIFMTRRGTVLSDPTYGTSFLPSIQRSNLSNDARIRELFGTALNEINNWMRSNVATAGVPDDEIVTQVELQSFSKDQGTLTMTLKFTTKAGIEMEYLVPVEVIPTEAGA